MSQIPLPTRIKAIYSENVFYLPTVSDLKAFIRGFKAPLNNVQIAILEFCYRIYAFGLREAKARKHLCKLVTSIANVILKYAFSTKDAQLERNQLNVFWESLSGELYELIENPQKPDSFKATSPMSLEYIKTYSGIGNQMNIDTSQGQQGPLLNACISIINALINYRRSQLGEINISEAVQLEPIPEFISAPIVGWAQEFNLVSVPGEVKPYKYLSQECLGPKETINITIEKTTTSEKTEELTESVVDSSSTQVVDSLSNEIQKQDSVKSGETTNSTVTNNNSETFSIGATVGLSGVPYVNASVNTNYNTNKSTTNSLNKTSNLEKLSNTVEKAVNSQVSTANAAREVKVESRKMSKDTTSMKNVVERTYSNPSEMYAMEINTYQVAQLYDVYLVLYGTRLVVSNGLMTKNLDSFDELEEYVDAEIYAKIIESIRNYEVKLYNGVKIKPFENFESDYGEEWLLNQDEQTKQWFKKGLPISLKTYPMLLPAVKMYYKLLREEDLMDERRAEQYDAQNEALRLLNEEKRANIEWIMKKNRFIDYLLENKLIDNMQTAKSISLYMFNQSDLQSKLYLFEKTDLKELDEIKM